MIGVMIGLIGVLAIFPYIAVFPAAAVSATFLFGACAFGTPPLLQTKVISSSENGTTIAAAVSVSAFNLANALGAWIGGLILGERDLTHGCLLRRCADDGSRPCAFHVRSSV